jgi:hypothetical protein
MYQMSQSYCSGCSGADYTSGGSQLEYIANNCDSNCGENTFYSVSEPVISESSFVPQREYFKQQYQKEKLGYDLFHSQPNYDFIPDNFLKPGTTGTFVGKADEIKEFIEDTFEKITGKEFPNDIKISVLEDERFNKLNNNLSVRGLSINRRKLGLVSEIFIRNDYLAKVMLTIGHELGHVLTKTLKNVHDEEAKAYSFSLEWMKIIKENNVGGLGEAIVLESPAQNGLHNVAFSFVQKMVKNKNFWEIYLNLVKEKVSIAS